MDRAASHVCKDRKSDCGGLCARLFVTILRANGIPARQLVGRWATSAEPLQKIGEVLFNQQHVKAEFYAVGIGWVPVDLSSAVQWDRSSDGLNYFGQDPGDFMVLHLDNMFHVETQVLGRMDIPYLQGVAFWVRRLRDDRWLYLRHAVGRARHYQLPDDTPSKAGAESPNHR